MNTLPGSVTAIAVCLMLASGASSQSSNAKGVASPTLSAVDANNASPLFGVTVPPGYRQWEMVAPSHEAGSLDELRGILGNPIAMKAYRDGTLPFPDGSMLAKLAWKHVPSTELEGAFVPGRATTVQIMVKDSKKYAQTGGWGFGRFIDGKPVDEAQHRTCFPCHAANVKGHDFVFTRLPP
jgi:Cytochrome P460